MWTPEHRRAAARVGLRYPNDLTDGERALIAPLIPPCKRGGRRREIDVREVLNAIFYVLSSGCQWKALPKGLPPKSTVHLYFMLRDWDSTLERIHHAFYIETREREGQEASPSAAIIDSQSAKAAQKGAKASIPQGFDAGKKVTGRKLHILVDTLGLLLSVAVHSASIQDRDGAAPVLDKWTRRLFPFIEHIYADGGYQATRSRRRQSRRLENRDRQTIRHRQGICRLAQKMGGRENLRLN
jgi:transposase